VKLGRLAGLIGGVFVLALVALVVLYGLQVPAVRAVLDPIGTALANLVQGFRGYNWPSLRTPASGNAVWAVGIALLGFTATTLLVTPARTGRGVIFTLLAWVLVGFGLYVAGT
jgi:hypothetical protein